MVLLGNFLGRLTDRNSARLALAGTVEGVLEVTDRPGNNANWIYARFDDTSAPFEAMVSVIRPNLNDVIWVIRENPAGDTGWRLLHWVRDFLDPNIPPPIDGRRRQLLLDSDAVQLVDSDGQLMEDHLYT